MIDAAETERRLAHVESMARHGGTPSKDSLLWLIALARRGLAAVELAEAADARRAALDKHERVDEPDCLAALEAFDTALDNWRRAKARQA